MDIFHSLFAARLVFVLGIANFLLVAMLFASCRCLPTSRIGAGLMKREGYKRWYKYHCYIWYALGMSVAVHAVFAVALAGVPF